MPADLRVRATMEQWLAWQQTELGPTWVYAFLALGRPTPGYDDEEKIAASIERWSVKMRILEAALAGGSDFICGQEFTLADIALGVSAHRWFATPFARPALPATEAYYARLKARPAAAPHLGEATP
jgi:glutathione S-transferase